MQQPIKVWHITTGGDRGGAKTHLLTLLPHLPRDEYEVKLICLNGGTLAADARAAGLAVEVVPMPRVWDISVIFRLAARMRREGVRIVHTHGVRANFCGRLAARLAGVPLVLTTLHSLVSLDYLTPMQIFLSRWADRLTAPLAHHCIAVSGALRAGLLRQGLPAAKITTIHNGIDLAPLASAADTAADALGAELGIPPDASVVGVVGRLVPVKAYDIFLRAAAQVARPGVYFLVTGDGPCEGELRELAGELGIADQVVFAGFRRDIPAILHRLDIFVISSLSEGLPIVLLEAMAAGRPVVATAVGGIPEVITDGADGWLVPPGDPMTLAAAVRDLLADPAAARRLGEQARTTVAAGYSRESFVQSTVELYRRLAARHLSERSG